MIVEGKILTERQEKIISGVVKLAFFGLGLIGVAYVIIVITFIYGLIKFL